MMYYADEQDLEYKLLIIEEQHQAKMICINSKRNPKLLQTFNNDPYSDIVIKTTNNQLHLVLGYLSIDSEYFNKIQPGNGLIDLSTLSQTHLIKVLRALYGEQFYACGVNQLKQIYSIVQYLEIGQYKKNINEFILKNEALMDNFQLIQFCISNRILEKQIRQHHYNLKLAVFASTKNYLQLNKISQSTLNSLLVQYSKLQGEEADSTINSIVENYIGRNNLRPNEFFTQPGNQHLLSIWEKFHHSISYLINAQEKVRQSQILSNDQIKKSVIYQTSFGQPASSLPSLTNMAMVSSLPSNLIPMKLSSINSFNSTFKSEVQKKNEIIKKLEQMVILNDSIIQNLRKEIENTKKDLEGQKMIPGLDDKDYDRRQKQRKRQFQEVIGLQNGDDQDVSLIEPPINQVRKIVSEQQKQAKTMYKLNTKARRIFN